MKKPRLEDWFVGPHDQLYGVVYDHPTFKDGEVITTTRVVTLDKNTGVVTTQNNEYILGKPAEAS